MKHIGFFAVANEHLNNREEERRVREYPTGSSQKRAGSWKRV